MAEMPRIVRERVDANPPVVAQMRPRDLPTLSDHVLFLFLF